MAITAALRAEIMLDHGGYCARCLMELEEARKNDLTVILDPRAEEIHHILSKGRTVKNEAAREASERKTLLVPLCRRHHTGSENAHNPTVAVALLQFNCQMYGYDVVKADYDAVVSALKHPLSIPFPEGEYELNESEPR